MLVVATMAGHYADPLKRRAGMISRAQTTLRSYAAQYAIERALAASSERALRYVLNSLELYLKRPATLDDLCSATLNGWITWMYRERLDPETIRGRRTATVGIWKHACEAELVTMPPMRIRKVKVPDKPPVCWDWPELLKLLDVARALTGVMNRDRRVSRADFWQAWLYVDYGTGLRLGDLRKLRFDNISSDGRTITVQSKTGDVVTGHIQPEGMAIVTRMRQRGRRLVFGDLVNHSNAQRYFRKLVAMAGLSGSTKWIRRTGATWLEVESPGSAQAYLGHRTPGLAQRNYIDRRFVQRDKPRPPKIG